MWIKGFEEKYTIDETGVVTSMITGQPLYVKYDKQGYAFVRLCDGNHNYTYPKLHRLVAEHFIPNPDNKPCVNHIDGNKDNPHISNLEWVTYSENMIHSARVLKRKCGNDKMPVRVHDKSGNFIGEFESVLAASKALNINRQSISLSIEENRFSKGMKFEYIK